MLQHFRSVASSRLRWPAAAILTLVASAGWAGLVDAGEVMSASDAHKLAAEGKLVLVDVRTPEEWRETGVPASAHAISMHQAGPEFVRQLDAALGGDRSKPLAIICRTGNRTGSIVAPLEKAGYGRVIDVSEGMAGGRNGRGWLKTGLPTRPWTAGQTAPVAVRP
jgi:rhodanese-related sulfurtransferase